MKQIRLSRKINQFKNTAQQINELIENRNWHTMSDSAKRRLQWKLNNLFSVVRHLFYSKQLKKILAGAAFIICIGTVNAQTFAPSVNNPFGLTASGNYVLPCFTDLDNDGDFDILAATSYGEIKFYENTGTATLPSYAAPQINPFGIYYPVSAFRPVTADLDDDGDLDLFTGEYEGAYKYFENTGTVSNPAFALPATNPFGLDSALEVGFPDFADFDNDGDMDLLSNEYYGVFKYYENTGTASNPNFAAPLINPFGFSVTSTDEAFPAVCDLDNDGDNDILVGSFETAGNMYFYENSGNSSAPDFTGVPLLNPFGITATSLIAVPAFGDIDDDGDMDLMVGDTTGNFIYFQNMTITSLGNFGNNSISFSLSPNPASEYTTISNGIAVQNCAIKISDINGKIIYESIAGSSETTVNTNSFSKGVYIIELSDGNYISRKKLIIK